MASAVPTRPSITQWLAVSTTAADIKRGDATANILTGIDRVLRKTTTPASTFQPTWKLGRAAYLLMMEGGWRYL
ncbi:MAG: hypothetical protein OXF00_00815 [bacterium]|nr:hypothetical protein [bacterium]